MTRFVILLQQAVQAVVLRLRPQKLDWYDTIGDTDCAPATSVDLGGGRNYVFRMFTEGKIQRLVS